LKKKLKKTTRDIGNIELNFTELPENFVVKHNAAKTTKRKIER